MTNANVKDILDLLLAAYPTVKQRMSEDDERNMLRAYRAGLVDLDFESARGGVGRLVRTSKWFPTIAEIRDAVVEVAHGARKNGGEAWGEVLAMIRKYGSHRWPGIDFQVPDPLVARAVKAFGWRDLCASESPVADRARFIELYDQLAREERTATVASPGAGTKALAPGDSPFSAALRLVKGDDA